MDRAYFKQKTFEAIKADSPAELQETIRALSYPVDIIAVLQFGGRVVCYVTQQMPEQNPEPYRRGGKAVKKLLNENGDT